MVRVVTFDFWYTLVRFREGAQKALLDLRVEGIFHHLRRYPFTRDSVINALQDVEQDASKKREESLEVSAPELIEQLLLRLHIPQDKIRHLLLPITNEFDHALLEVELETIDHASLVLETLRRTGYGIGMVSNTSHGSVLRTILKRFHLFHYFDCFVFSNELGIRKPSPLIFAEAIMFFRADPYEVVHVGDTAEHDVAGAKRAGLRAIHLNEKEAPYPPIFTPPDATVKSLKEIPRIIATI